MTLFYKLTIDGHVVNYDDKPWNLDVSDITPDVKAYVAKTKDAVVLSEDLMVASNAKALIKKVKYTPDELMTHGGIGIKMGEIKVWASSLRALMSQEMGDFLETPLDFTEIVRNVATYGSYVNDTLTIIPSMNLVDYPIPPPPKGRTYSMVKTFELLTQILDET